MIGSISHGTLRPEDLYESFLDCALRLADEKQIDDPTLLERVKDIESFVCLSGEERMEAITALEDILNEMALPYTYFGAHEGDGSDFGFWPSWGELDDLTKYDDFPATLPDDDFMMVNDHGNVSVYGADGKLIWDCV